MSDGVPMDGRKNAIIVGADADMRALRAIETMELAILRTELANRRTFLAYVKTALGMAIAGLGFFKFANEDPILIMVGLIALPLSVIVLLYGVRDYRQVHRAIAAERQEAGLDRAPPP